MTRADVTELHYITAIANVPSILENGILSHALAQAIPYESIAERGVQDRREAKAVPGGRTLHEYANLYFDAHNPMLSALVANDVALKTFQELNCGLPVRVSTSLFFH